MTRSRLLAVLASLALAAAVAFGLHPNAAYAADPVVTGIEVQAPEHVTIGDRFRFVIRLEADRGTVVSLAPGGLPEALSRTSDIETQTRNLSSGRQELTVSFEAAAFVVGDLQLPPLLLRYRNADGATGEIETAATRLVVESVLPESGSLAPRDLKPQAEIGAPGPGALARVLVALAIALLIVVGLIVWRWRRIQARPVVEPALEPAPLGPEDRARRVLDGGSALLAQGEYAAYYSTLASAVRNYLTERYEFPAFALTTTEMQERMVRQGMDRWQARLVAGLLNQCDAVVFAQYRPAPERADADLTAAYEIVEMSRPGEPEREEVVVS
jgi:hypothetical protein